MNARKSEAIFLLAISDYALKKFEYPCKSQQKPQKPNEDGQCFQGMSLTNDPGSKTLYI
jgi:hypothetical protein